MTPFVPVGVPDGVVFHELIGEATAAIEPVNELEVSLPVVFVSEIVEVRAWSELLSRATRVRLLPEPGAVASFQYRFLIVNGGKAATPRAASEADQLPPSEIIWS